MKLTKKQEEQIQSYLEEQIEVEGLVKNGDVRVGNFLVVYERTVNENFYPENADNGDPEWKFDICVMNDVNDATQSGDHMGSHCMEEIYGDEHDVWLCFNVAMRNFFYDYEWESDEWSMKTFGF